MEEYRAVCDSSDLPPGTSRRVEIDGKAIALFHVDGTLYAIEDTCLHAGGPLHEGTVDGTIVTCPWHQWQFDLKTGCTPLNHKVRLECYAVRVRNGRVEVWV